MFDHVWSASCGSSRFFTTSSAASDVAHAFIGAWVARFWTPSRLYSFGRRPCLHRPVGGALRDPVWPLPSPLWFRTSPVPSPAHGWRASGPCLASPLTAAHGSPRRRLRAAPRLASPLSTAPSSRGCCSCPPRDTAPSSRGLHAHRRCAFACGRAALLPAGGHRDIHARPHVAAQRPCFLRLADVFFIRHDAYCVLARPPPPVGMPSPSLRLLPSPAAPFRLPVPCPGPRLRPHPPRPLWCFLPDTGIVPCLNSGGACVVITD